jgi:hypothetical protein
MATGLNKLNFILVHPDKIPSNFRDDYPPKPLSGIQYTPYDLSENAILKKIEKEILPTINEVTKHEKDEWCLILKGKCPYEKINVEPNKIFIGLPYNKKQGFFEGVEKLLKSMLDEYDLEFFKPAKSLNELCQLCRKIRQSSFCIVDTTFNDITMLFVLGVTFGKGKKFIQLHDTSLSHDRPISDLRQWAIEYKNISELEKTLKEELKKWL